MKTVLTIAGSDPSGGAGIQADIKTLTVNGVYAMSAVTALTAQNTAGVFGILEVPPDFLGKQIDAVFEDIRPDAVKIGLVPSPALVRVIAERLRFYGAERVVVDPVMAASVGSPLMKAGTAEALKEWLLPLALLVTPNLREAEVLSGMPVRDRESMQAAAGKLAEQCGAAVLLKGGHSAQNADDLLFRAGVFRWFPGERIDNPNTHGTGCTLSSAIAANLAKGFSPEEAIRRAKEYLSGALRAMLDLGKGSGPLHHAFDVTGRYTEEAGRL